MAISKPATKPAPKPAPAPAKPAPKPSAPVAAKPAPKPAPAPPKPAPVAAKPAAAKPAAPAPAKPAPVAKPAAPAPKPAAPAPAKPAAAAPASGGLELRIKALEEQLATVATVVEDLASRLANVEIGLAGYGEHVSVNEEGMVVLDYDAADENTLRDWAHQFGVGDSSDTPENIKAALQAHEASKDFAGWVIQNELPRPDGGEAAAEEQVSISADDVAKMNLSELRELAGELGLSVETSETPKVLRNRILEALTAEEPAAEEEAAAEEGEEAELEVGASLIVTHPETQATAEGTFQGYDEDGDVLVDCEEFGGRVSLPAEFVAVA